MCKNIHRSVLCNNKQVNNLKVQTIKEQIDKLQSSIAYYVAMKINKLELNIYMNKLHKSYVMWNREVYRRMLTVQFWVIGWLYLTTTGTLTYYGPGTEYQLGTLSAFAVSNLSLANLWLSRTGPGRTYVRRNECPQLTQAGKEKMELSSAHDPRKPHIDKNRARLTQGHFRVEMAMTHMPPSHTAPIWTLSLMHSYHPGNSLYHHPGSPFIFSDLCILVFFFCILCLPLFSIYSFWCNTVL